MERLLMDMINLSKFFQLSHLPTTMLHGSYNPGLVAISYVIAFFTSYIALDFSGRLRMESQPKIKWYWLIGGAFSMGAGIWSMHFIGMLAFIMPMPMTYDPSLTLFSLIVAIISSGFALFLLRNEKNNIGYVFAGGIVLGLGISTMHYMGMAGMKGVSIRYLPGLFILSIVIAIFASEVGLWFILKSNKGSFVKQIRLKVMGALVMGAAICGMHYTGMSAAIFTPLPISSTLESIDLYSLSLYITCVTGTILIVSLIVSAYQQLIAVSKIAKELEYVNGELEAFAYITSHDLKAPLRAIEHLTSWIGEDSYSTLNEESKKNFDLLKKRVQRMSTLIDGILRYSRVGSKNIEVSKVNVQQLLDDIILSLSVPSHFSIKIVLKMPILVTSEILLQQVFSNLISNAIKHHKGLKGNITISSIKLGNYYRFCVADDGPGISSEYQDKIFDIYQTQKTDNERNSAGIGLAIVKKAVDRVSGNVWVKSDAGIGSAFYFTWPAKFVSG